MLYYQRENESAEYVPLNNNGATLRHKVVIGGLIAAFTLLCGYVSPSFNSYADLMGRDLSEARDLKSEHEIEYAYGIITPNPPEDVRRIPEGAVHYQVNLFDQPAVQQALAKAKNPMIREVCSGPTNNIDVFINEEMVKADILGDEPRTIFGLDCRLTDYPHPSQIAFLVVLDMRGNVVNIVELPSRAESVNMYNTTTLLAATREQSFLWNYQTGYLEYLPFFTDMHTLMYRATENKFYACYPDKVAMELHNPNTICSFDPATGHTIFDDETGQTDGWAWSDEDSHMNYITFGGDNVYVSERANSAIKKVNMLTNEVEWTLGGPLNDFTIYNYLGEEVSILQRFDSKTELAESLPWNHQHKFQHWDDQYFSLFDNNVGEGHEFVNKPWGLSSRMVVLYVDQATLTAWEVFSYPVGDRGRSYGGTDATPSGNLLGSCYVDWVFPSDEDHQYHENIWEVNPKGELAMRIGFKGLNLVQPDDTTNPHPHYVRNVHDAKADLMSVGWNIYTAERTYPRPVVNQPCQFRSDDGGLAISFIPFNTIKSQEDYPGGAYLSVTNSGEYFTSQNFYFQKAFLPRPMSLAIPPENENQPITLTVVNHWQEYNDFELGVASQLPACPGEDVYRSFYPSN